VLLPRALLVAAGAVAALGAGPQQTPSAVDAAFTRQTVETVAATIDREYFDPAVAARLAATLTSRLAQGRYDAQHTAEELAGALTRDLLSESGDKHLAVTVVRAPDPSPAPAGADGDRALRGRRSNFGVQGLEILPGNVGYLNLTSFYRPAEAGDVFAAAARTLRSADALILDLRQNGGGSPDMVALVASHMFDGAGLPLFEIVPRPGGDARRYSTQSPGVADRNGSRPLYVLTAAGTFSAGEGLAFILQERHRATVVGERTAGAANPGRPYPVNAQLEVVVPNGRVRTAVTGRNWEGTGVSPDLGVPASDALRSAHALALRELLSRTPDGPWGQALRQALAAIERRHES
jgi:retinol-binding protein 3